MKILSNSMNPMWKLSFVATVFWLGLSILGAFSDGSYFRPEWLVWGSGPISVWFSARWVAIGDAHQGG